MVHTFHLVRLTSRAPEFYDPVIKELGLRRILNGEEAIGYGLWRAATAISVSENS